ncbi:RagB/SusD family nutrient uptake outer membrane protein [Niabella beijingensis]|uniref:RagB/SusD family nutrient uptake outer membrane protein n=1 Tax=Niabella beijingensis TaxID=2872700 RepID=UPI001CBBA049|nr:RagB/SusD family nutrient uptake outer membrane protein [Niabella beijingensis]MBZ4189904.1 RagB/SusD family nutrient uptake outer membrane protein [Niabella beijingensis]
MKSILLNNGEKRALTGRPLVAVFCKRRLLWCCFLGLLITGACNKQLDLPSDGRLGSVEEAFTDYNRVRGYLNSCYGYCPEPSMDRASYTDEAEDADAITSGSNFLIWYRGTITASTYATYSSDGSPWTNLFQGIYKCNTFLKQIKTATAIVSDEEKAGWIAQAHTLRALYYLQLIKRYGGVPVFKEPLELNHDFSQDHRATFGEVVRFILADCDSALAAPDTQTGFSWNIYDNQFGIMNRAVPYAIKSQAVTYAVSPLWADGSITLEEATRITGEALFRCLANGYQLFDVEPSPSAAQNAYAFYFITSSNDKRSVDKETIYQRGSQMQVWRDAGMPSTPNMTKAGPCPTQDLVDAYEMANGEPPITGYSDADHLVPVINPASGYDPENPYAGRDPRFYASVYYNGAVRYLNQPAGKKVAAYEGGADGISASDRRFTRTGYYQRKFNNSQSGQGNNADGAIRLLRLGELYLNFAEVAYQAGGPDEPVSIDGTAMTAREAVNAIRKRAGMPGFPAGMSKEAFEKKYRNERRIELAFEEHRFFDVRRWKLLGTSDKFVTGMRIRQNGNNLTYTRFRFSNRGSTADRFLMYPIDQSEVDKIIGLSGVNWQNPGW